MSPLSRLSDCLQFDTKTCMELRPTFGYAIVDKVKMEKGKVMVHCQAGISRSAALTISYIMKSKMISCEQAYR